MVSYQKKFAPRRIVREDTRAFSNRLEIEITPPRKRSSGVPDELNDIAVEVKRLGTELNLSDTQKELLRTFLTDRYDKLQEFKKPNPNLSKEDIVRTLVQNRNEGWEKIEKVLTLVQLKIWDAEVTKANEFLSQRARLAVSTSCRKR